MQESKKLIGIWKQKHLLNTILGEILRQVMTFPLTRATYRSKDYLQNQLEQ